MTKMDNVSKPRRNMRQLVPELGRKIVSITLAASMLIWQTPAVAFAGPAETGGSAASNVQLVSGDEGLNDGGSQGQRAAAGTNGGASSDSAQLPDAVEQSSQEETGGAPSSASPSAGGAGQTDAAAGGASAESTDVLASAPSADVPTGTSSNGASKQGASGESDAVDKADAGQAGAQQPASSGSAAASSANDKSASSAASVKEGDADEATDDEPSFEASYTEESSFDDGQEVKAIAVRVDGETTPSEDEARKALEELSDEGELGDTRVDEALEQLFTEPIDEPRVVLRSDILGENVSTESAEDDEPAATEQALRNRTSAPGASAGVLRAAEDGEGGEGDSGDEEAIPRKGDGTEIIGIDVKWITKDTVDNGDASVLYIKPPADEKQSVKLQINYALGGEHNYNPGDVIITIPASIFHDRDGNSYGTTVVPFPEDPSTRSDFNWKLVGDEESGYFYQLTNTRRMSAASTGFIQIAFAGLIPHELVDMQRSDPFDARIEVVTHLGNLLALGSNEIAAEFDTEAKVTHAQKRVYNGASIIPASDSRIPAEKRALYPDEEYFVYADWYAWGFREANTEYTMDVIDHMVDGSGVIAYKQGEPDATIEGFVINRGGSGGTVSMSDNDRTLTRSEAVRDHVDGETAYYYFATVYPFSQFEKDTQYRFTNTTTFRITEVDDPKLVTEESSTATTPFEWSDPEWINPRGHYMVHKNGDDDDEPAGGMSETTHWDKYSYSDRLRGGDGYYGIYPSALNDLQDGMNVRLSYVVNTIGYVMPWMYDSSNPAKIDTSGEDGAERVARSAQNYVRPVAMETLDTGLSLTRNGEKLVRGTDYNFLSVEFTEPAVYKATPHNINPDGTWQAIEAGDGTFTYDRDYDKKNWPQINLEIQLEGSDEWIPWATADWTSGSLAVTLVGEGASRPDATNYPGVVSVPENTANWRTSVLMQNDPTSPVVVNDNYAIQAAIQYDVRPVVELLATSETMQALVEQAFPGRDDPNFTPNPAYTVWNGAEMTAYRPNEETMEESFHPEIATNIVTIDKDGYDSIRGYTTDVEVYPTKKADQDLDDQDSELQRVTIHFSAQVDERSFIADRATYLRAIEDGRLTAETHGVWRDLLPRGVIPLTDTIELRDGDTITKVKTYDNYKGSGRTLLEVEADLTPVPNKVKVGDMEYWQDSLTIKFDAIYGFSDIVDYGTELHNVISFESSNDHIGTIENRRGEADDPNYKEPETGHNGNIVTGMTGKYGDSDYGKITFRSDDEGAEVRAMTGLDSDRIDPETGKPYPSFVYAGTWFKLDLTEHGQMGLSKDVQVNRDGWWSDGLYYNNKEANQRNVYTGGVYSYRLRATPDTMSGGGDPAEDKETILKDMVFYDVLEEFEPGTYGTNSEEGVDYNVPDADGNVVEGPAESWRGTLIGVDTSFLTEEGCAPVVYYCVQEGLELGLPQEPTAEHPEGAVIFNPAYSIDADNSVWVRADDYDGDLANVRAIAVDARKASDGSDYTIKNTESVVVLVNMRAPSGEDASAYIDKEAHAYNNVWITSKTVVEGAESDSTTHKEYTKVGLEEVTFEATKVWNDDNDRDGLRPESVTLELLADGEPTGETVTLPIVDPDTGEESWTATFRSLVYCGEDGNVITYSVREAEEVEGYTATTQPGGLSSTITNKHQPMHTSVPVTKLWVQHDEDGNDVAVAAEDLPEYITFTLYGVLADGAEPTRIASKTVYPDASGAWAYTFENLFKYRDGGTPIEYSVVETLPPRDSHTASFPLDLATIEGSAADGFTITNVRYPYGDLKVTKSVENTTPAEDGTEFAFTFRFTTTNAEGESMPVMGDFAYDVLDADGNVVEGKSGTVACDGTVRITGGQSIYVRDLPEYIHYSVSEGSNRGFTLSSSTGTTGTIQPNDAQEAAFTNTYAATGRVSFGATKRLNNRELNPYQFRFEVKDETGATIRTATSGRSTESVADKDGTVEYSAASVTFGAIRYTLDDMVDADGKRVATKDFTYTVSEVNAGKPGYTYDDMVYTVVVTVTDYGQGALQTSYKYYDKDGNKLREAPQFENTYEAKGSIDLKAWKDLQGRSLKDGEFTFVLTDGEGNEITTVTNNAEGLVLFAAKDGEEVNISELNFDQGDVGKTFHFAVYERKGSDPTVNYSDAVFGYEVTVLDNGDGTLSLAQGNATPIFTRSTCEACEGEGLQNDKKFDWDESYTTPRTEGPVVLDMRIEDGKATIDHNFDSALWGILARPIVENGTVANGQIKTPDGSTVSYPERIVYQGPTGDYGRSMKTWFAFIMGEANEREGKDVACEIPDSSLAYYYLIADSGDAMTGTSSSPTVRYRLGYIPFCEACGGSGEVVVITGWKADEGDVPVFENTLKDGNLTVTKYVSNPEDADPSQEFTFHVRLMGEDVDDSTVTEYTLQQAAPQGGGKKSASSGKQSAEGDGTAAADPQTAAPAAFDPLGALASLFAPQQAYAAEGVFHASDEQLVGNAYAVFTDDGELVFFRSNDVYENNTSGTFSDTQGRSYTGTVYAGVETIDCNAHPGSTYAVDPRSSSTIVQPLWAEHSTEIKKVSIASGYAIEPISTAFWFSMAAQGSAGVLEEVDLSRLDTSSVERMCYMFNLCKKIESLDLSAFDTSNVRTMAGMFRNNASLTNLTINTFDTSKVESFYEMFHACITLPKADVGGFNTSSAKNMNMMFSQCYELAECDVSHFDTSSVTDMSGMFRYCKAITALDVSGFDTSSATMVDSLFEGCYALKNVNVGGFDLAKVETLDYVFEDCRSLTSLDVRSWQTGHIKSMRYLFARCFSLSSLDLSTWDTGNVLDMCYMFNGDSKLAHLDLSDFDTRKVS